MYYVRTLIHSVNYFLFLMNLYSIVKAKKNFMFIFERNKSMNYQLQDAFFLSILTYLLIIFKIFILNFMYSIVNCCNNGYWTSFRHFKFFQNIIIVIFENETKQKFVFVFNFLHRKLHRKTINWHSLSSLIVWRKIFPPV